MGRLFLVAALAALTFAGPALAQDLNGTWRPPPIGTKVAQNNGIVYEVLAAEGGDVFVKGDRNMRVQNTSWSIYKGFCFSMNFDGSAIACEKKGIDSLFPLAVGKTAKWTRSIGQWRVATTYKVSSVKTIETVLGSREVFGIVYSDKGTHGNRWHSKGFFYFDPALGLALGGRYVQVNNDNRTENWRVVCLNLPE